MSLFPAADPAKLRAAIQQQARAYQTPSSSASEQHAAPMTATAANAWSASEAGFADASSWPPHDLHGLGLHSNSHPASSAAYPPTSSHAASSIAMSMVWPSALEYPASLSHADVVANGMYQYTTSSTTAEPLCSTTTSSTPPFQTLASDMSPPRSEYSPSSQHSVLASSPYAPSYHHQGSPCIKVEDSSDMARSRLCSVPGYTPLEHQMLVNPNDVYSSPSLSSNDHLSMASLHMQMKYDDDADVKPYPFMYHPDSMIDYPCDDDEESIEERHKRSYTTSENFTCTCEQCGKIFQRPYNLKAHMETHDPHREQPHACRHEGCTRRFVRRTDLLRHQQSVHLKTREHHCEWCHNSFARKDTLRRHKDDGCPRRSRVRRGGIKSRRGSAMTTVSNGSTTTSYSSSERAFHPSPHYEHKFVAQHFG